MIWNEILCLGDSLTYGARDEYGRSYPAELGMMMSKETGEFYICHNYGVNGETSSDLLKRSWGILRSNKESKIMLLMIGTNDTKKPTPLNIYRDNLRQIILSAKAHGMNVFLATLPQLGFSPHYLTNNEYIKKYNDEIEYLSNKLGCYLCRMDGLEKHLIDGVHFTHKGYEEIAKRWAKKLQEIRE